MSNVLLEHGTQLSHLKPANICQAAKRDFALRERKREGKADEGERYSFSRNHVRRAQDPVHLITLAFWGKAPKTDKRSTLIVYSDRELLKEALKTIVQEL